MLIYFLSRPNTSSKDIAFQLDPAKSNSVMSNLKPYPWICASVIYYRLFRPPAISSYFFIPLRVWKGHFIYILYFLFDRNLKIGYFSQHHVDQLGSEQTPLELLASKFPGTNNTECRLLSLADNQLLAIRQTSATTDNVLLKSPAHLLHVQNWITRKLSTKISITRVAKGQEMFGAKKKK